jgi:hypothetical protein
MRSTRLPLRGAHHTGVVYLVDKRGKFVNAFNLQRPLEQTARERLTPLEERLSRLLATIPSEIKREGLSLASLQASLWGRWLGKCHPGELGLALPKVGFKRERRWHDDSGFQALWYLS